MGLEVGLLIGLAALLGNAFFVGAEFGLISVRRSTVELKAMSGSRPAKITLKGMEDVSLMLAGAQLGITVCSLILGAVAEPILAHLLEGPFHAIGVPDILLHPIAFAFALTITVYLHVVVGEMIPKNIALAKPEKVALFLTPLLVLIVKILQPIVKGFNIIANLIIRLLGVEPRPEIASTFTRDEVEGFIKESHREGLLTSEEEHLLSGAISFNSKKITSVLIPLKSLITISNKATAASIEELSVKYGYSRFPILSKNNKITGYVHIKDVLQIKENEYDLPIPKKLIRSLPSLKEKSSLRLALKSMQNSGAHICEVNDSKNNLIGIVYLEDVLEKLVGEIHDSLNKI